MSPLPALATLLLAAILVGIFLLAQQGTKGTRDLAWRTEQLLMRIIPPTGRGSVGEPTWWGLTIRRLAHVAEYALLGLAAMAALCTFRGVTLQTILAAQGLCLLASVGDELHKAFVPGRHFDAADLVLDALGYAPAVLLCAAVAALVS